jgi:3-hydroxyisobutyrate dehydrogenase
MVGAGSEADFDKAKPLLELMGKNIVYCGANGNGQVAKICNNMLLGISMIAVSETMQLGIRMGMDPKLLANILNTSSGRCWSSDTYNPCPDVIPNTPSCKGYTGGFGNTLMAKDLRLAMNAAQESNSTVLMGALASQVYNRVSNEKEYRGLDFSSVFKVMWSGGEGRLSRDSVIIGVGTNTI